MFHTITYGKGLMGAHASQLNKEERWKLVHYIRTGFMKETIVAEVIPVTIEEVVETIVEPVMVEDVTEVKGH